MSGPHEVTILGGGVAGLAAASVLGDRAVVLERETRPGGLVRTECVNGYWFDRVLHILHFQDDETEARIRGILGDDLARVVPEAWVETAGGTVRYPFQLHLGRLDSGTVVRCLRDLAEATFTKNGEPARNFEEMLLRTFGRSMCDAFLLPYNRKMWKRPLDTLAPSGFQWTITHPDFASVLEGAINPDANFRAYNANGWYPRPPRDAPLRGMEVLSRALAARASDLRFCHEVVAIDPARRRVAARTGAETIELEYERACVSTLPLPLLIGLCAGVPEDLRERCAALPYNRVITAAFCVRGPRPEGRGHWRYYGDERLSFTRLIYMHEFDPFCAPPDGWGLMAEITEPAEQPSGDAARALRAVADDVRRAGALPAGNEIVDARLFVADPAYVVFTPESRRTVEDALAFLWRNDIHPLGRYGRWEYSSMAQVMADGFRWASAIVEGAA